MASAMLEPSAEEALNDQTLALAALGRHLAQLSRLVEDATTPDTDQDKACSSLCAALGKCSPHVGVSECAITPSSPTSSPTGVLPKPSASPRAVKAMRKSPTEENETATKTTTDYVTDDHIRQDSHHLERLRGVLKSRVVRSEAFSTGGGLDRLPQWGGYLKQLISDPRWDTFWAVIIFISITVLMVEDQYYGIESGYDRGYYTEYGSPAYLERWWPSAVTVFLVLEVVFSVAFTVELMATIINDILCKIYRVEPEPGILPIWRSPLGILDATVVVLSDVALMQQVFNLPFKLNLLRIFRIARLMRFLRLLRHIESFDPLLTMICAMKGSVEAQLAAYMLLFLALTLPSMIITNVVRMDYLNAENSAGLSEEVRTELYEYFGTFTRALLTFLELALADFPPVTRFLMEEVHELFAVLCVTFKLTVGFTMISLIHGVFIKACFDAAENDDVILVRNRMKQVSQHRDRMTRLFALADHNGDGALTKEELAEVLKVPVLKIWLEAMDLRVTDSDVLFDMMSDANGLITSEQLIQGVSRLRGTARNIDLVRLMNSISGA